MFPQNVSFYSQIPPRETGIVFIAPAEYHAEPQHRLVRSADLYGIGVNTGISSYFFNNCNARIE